MKTGKFRNLKFSMEKGSGYGQYVLLATYKGMDMGIHTTESEVWDWLDDDSNKKEYNYARRYCYNLIVSKYNRM